ncbi:WD repeat-containing protein 53 [Entomortierella chlamydospora]|uniref:WD repeat-containing protein 53 n=1 Tax=Entomortierella chlamydospora TaxID=101097 RepID=A0A9P6MXZ9_9FUNG|nr:WD repeat-containing protein 53 [Entomortierella chlamydospora]
MAQLQQQPTSLLIGHVAPVLTLDNQEWMLASGSEDKTCRIWDLRTNKVHKALTGFESSVITTAFTPADAHTIYVGSGNTIYTYDLRMESLILNTAQSTKTYGGAEDEINQIQVNHRATYLAACDDAGDVRVLDLKSHKWMRQFERKHDNIAMTIQFVPKKDLQALSGGMDKLVVAWDFYKSRATQLIDTDNPQPDGVQSKQLFNPPFVHSIAVHPSGTRAAIGLGDGSIQFLHTSADPPTAPSTSEEVGAGSSKKSKKKASSGGSGKNSEGWLLGGRLSDAHASPVATIEYAGFNPEWLVTSASNGSIAIWDDRSSRYESVQQQQLLQELVRKQQPPESLPYGRPLQPMQEFRTRDVFERVNCISTGKSADSGGSKKLFVAGTHPRIGEKSLQGRIAVYHL